jgi:hypothetical protein
MYQKHTREIKKTQKEREKEGGRLDGVLGWQVELANLEEKRREEKKARAYGAIINVFF